MRSSVVREEDIEGRETVRLCVEVWDGEVEELYVAWREGIARFWSGLEWCWVCWVEEDGFFVVVGAGLGGMVWSLEVGVIGFKLGPSAMR